jgi:hypothetical protein
MIPVLQKFFALFKKPAKTTEKIIESPLCIHAEPEFSELQTTVLDLINKNQQVLLFKDTDGHKLQELKSILERNSYFCYFLNTRDRVGPFNIFRHMTEDNYMNYVKILSVNNKTESVRNLNALLLTSILLSMIEAEELNWTGFAERVNSIERSVPEFVTAAVDDKIKNAFYAFKEQVKVQEFFKKEFDFVNKEKYLATEAYVPEGKVAVFYEEYTGEDAFLNAALLLETDEKGRL